MAKDTSFSEKKYYSISEVSKLCAVKPHTLRFWESEFRNLKPITRKGKRRYYQEEDIKIVKRIQNLLYKEGLTIAGVKRRLSLIKEDHSLNESSEKILADLENLLKVI